MIAIDINVLVSAHRAESDFRAQAFECLKLLAEGRQPWAMPMSCPHEFLAVVTNPKLFSPASKHEQALTQVDAWLTSTQAHVLHSGSQHWRILSALTRKAKLARGQFHVARITAICIENGVSTIWSAGREFGRFKDLKTVNPLV